MENINPNFAAENWQNILILGDGDIARALADELHQRNPNAAIFMTSRKDNHDSYRASEIFSLSPLEEDSWRDMIEKLSKRTSQLDVVIFTYGVLHDDHISPEKSLRDINFEQMQKVFSINAFCAPLAAKYLKPFLSRERHSVFAFLSAKVGSLDDNRMGGWYSYRASKAALNMFIKNIAIEFSRKNLKTSVIAIHPGTTKTRLSTPYLKGTNLKVWGPRETSAHLCQVIEKAPSEGTGLFKNWDGKDLPW